jgi:hypothetical protein
MEKMDFFETELLRFKKSRKMAKAAKTSGDKKTKKVLKKDPDAPKRALSAFMLYSQEQRPIVKKENPDAAFGIFYYFYLRRTRKTLGRCLERLG